MNKKKAEWLSTNGPYKTLKNCSEVQRPHSYKMPSYWPS